MAQKPDFFAQNAGTDSETPPIAGQVDGWFTEEWVGEGAAISFQIKRKLAEKQSAFQKVEVFETARFGNLLTLDGLVMVTTRDNFYYHEMLSHPALFTHPNPKDVLIIGGGDCGTMQQVLRHRSVQHATQVEIDEDVTRLSEVYFPELCSDNNDPRAAFHFEDGIEWVQRAAPESYDVILVDGSDPLGPAAVLFSEEFYAACLKALRPGGIMAGQSEAPLFHMDLLRHVHRTARAVGFDDCRTLFFPQFVYPSGSWSATLARKGGDLATPAAEGFAERFAALPPTMYYTPEIHAASFAQPAFFRAGLAQDGL